MNKNNLAIFDLDGTLFDTDEVNYIAYKQALEEYNVTFEKDYYFSKCCGNSYRQFLPPLVGDTEKVEKVHDKKVALYPSLLDKAKVNVHLFNMIRLLGKFYHTAVVTTASKKNTFDILNYYKVEDLFELVLTKEDVLNIKPSSDGFLKAMEFFKVSPQQTVIFEDSESGIKAAEKTGATVLIVNNF